MTLKRTPETPRERPTTFYDAREGVLWGENGARYSLDAQDSPSAILARLAGIYARGAVTCYLVGGASVADAPGPDWYKRAGGDGWQVEYRHDSTPARRTATYTRADSPTVQFRHSAAWFGSERHVAHMRSAFRIASSRLDHLFGSGVLLGSPAQTGQALLLRSLPFGAEYDALPGDLQAHVRANSPQARREVYPEHYGATIPALYYYDARLAYGACVRGVPCGDVFHRTPTRAGGGGTLDIDPYARALWLCEWRVPPRWEHIGVLPERPERPGESWAWPREPGTWHRGWIWAPALAAARNESWEIHVREGYEWIPRTAKGSDPLRGWGDKLLTLYMEASDERYGPCVAPLVRAIARSVLLSTIGAFHRRDTKQTHIVPLGGALDYPMDYPRELKPWGWEIEVPAPLSAHAARFAHPEWSAWIWATQYSRMTRRILSRYPGDVIGCNTDAIYTTALQSDWTDSGKVGEYRLKGRLRGSRPTPATLAELGKLKTESEGAYSDA